ncbi:hypothetical protein ACFLTC_03535 [Chloroflexota bacterium]
MIRRRVPTASVYQAVVALSERPDDLAMVGILADLRAVEMMPENPAR